MIVDFDPDAERDRRNDDAAFWAERERVSQAQWAAFEKRFPPEPVPYQRMCPTCSFGVILDGQPQCQGCISIGATDIPNTHYEVHK